MIFQNQAGRSEPEHERREQKDGQMATENSE